MAKPKKEFKARVRKVQKHLKALTELAVSTQQRDALYRVQGEFDFLESTLEQEFDSEAQDGTLHDLKEDRRGPIPVAG